MRDVLRVFPSRDEFQLGAARTILQELQDVAAARGSASLVLSGGSTPKAVYELLATQAFRSELDWNKTHMFWTDERPVPSDHPESNFRMVHTALLQHIDLPPGNIHRIEAERPPTEAAELYEQEMKAFFGPGQRLPQFDLVLLGLGEDGHTASLFPGTEILYEKSKLVASTFVPTLGTHRISMTFPVINNARRIVFLVAGAAKARIVHEVLGTHTDRYPAQFIQPTNGQLTWVMDAEAAGQLSQGILQQHGVQVS